LGFALVLFLSGNFNSSPTFNSPTFALPILALTVVLSIVAALFAIFELGAVTSFVSERFLERPITVWQAYKNAFGRGLSLFMAALLLVLAYIGVVSILGAVFIVPLLIAVVS